jgi:hypothetical protein
MTASEQRVVGNTTSDQHLPPVTDSASHVALRRRLLPAVQRHAAWLDGFGMTSQDAYDFWASPLGGRAKAYYYAGRFAGRAAVAPFALLDAALPRSRALVWPRSRFPIADAHWVMGFAALAKVTGQGEWLERAADVLEDLRETRCPDMDEYAWGYPFDWVTCFGTFPKGLPLITTIPYVYEACAAYARESADPQWPSVMESIARFVSTGIPDTPTAADARASAYTPLDSRKVVNASAYRGFLLVDAGDRFGRQEWQEQGLEYLRFVMDSQRADGSWLYAMDGKDAFVDNFHTCFVLKNLVKASRKTRSSLMRTAIEGVVQKGYAYYADSLLDDGGEPIPFAVKHRLSLVRRELYDYAEGINLARLLLGVIPEAEAILWRLTEALLMQWQLPDGRFATRRTVFGTARVPYHRWAQSQTFNALCQLLADQV